MLACQSRWILEDISGHLQDSLHPQDIFITAGKRRSSVTSDRRVPSEELQQSPSVNARSQEGSISEPLLKIFKTSGRRRSLLPGEFLVWSSLCKASSKVQAVIAMRQEGKSLVTRRNKDLFTNILFFTVAVIFQYSLSSTTCSAPCHQQDQGPSYFISLPASSAKKMVKRSSSRAGQG